MKNIETLTIMGIEFPTRSAAARHYGLEPKLVNTRVTKLGWSLAQAVGAEPRPSKALGMAKTTLARKLKAGDGIEVRQQLKGPSKPVLYNGLVYPSVRHLLLENPELVAGGDVKKMVASLSQKARRAKVKGKTLGLSWDDVSAKLDVDKLWYMDEFDTWVGMVIDQVGDSGIAKVFYHYKP